MTFQFFSGRRVPHSASDNSEETDAATSARCIERACAAFLTTHDAIIALTEGCDDLNGQGLPELSERRDKAFRQVRTQAARTRRAYLAKMRVLIVMRDWFAVDYPDVSAFAMEMALEAAALFDNDPGQECACMTRGETFEHHSRGAERRNPLAWFVRPWGNATDTPFAN
jgi:hypothetical protein